MLSENHNRATLMLYHACEFSESADLLLAEDRRKKLGECKRYFTPAVVSLSLSCEIYIKTLLVCYNISFDKIHLLDKLFDKLPKELKRKIKSESGIDESFLSEFSTTFTTRRYFYESTESITFLNIGNLKELRDVLRDESCKAVHSITWTDYRQKMGW